MKERLQHLGIINDGNRRWATLANKTYEDGYMAGARKGVKVVRWCLESGIRHLSAFAVSQENVQHRPPEEINAALNATLLFCEEVRQIPDASLRIFGDVVALPKTAHRREELIKLLKEVPVDRASRALEVHIGINYSSQAELTTLLRSLQKEGVEAISREPRDFILSAHVPDIDLLIRTGGRRRLSGFLPLQSAYAELHFIDVLWPTFSRKNFDEALDWFNRQERHFGE